MRRANLLVVADTSNPALARLRELAAERKRAEDAFKRAFEEERAEAIRLIESNEAGTVAIAEVMGRTREALRQSYNRWKAGKGSHDVARTVSDD